MYIIAVKKKKKNQPLYRFKLARLKLVETTRGGGNTHARRPNVVTRAHLYETLLVPFLTPIDPLEYAIRHGLFARLTPR